MSFKQIYPKLFSVRSFLGLTHSAEWPRSALSMHSPKICSSRIRAMSTVKEQAMPTQSPSLEQEHKESLLHATEVSASDQLLNKKREQFTLAIDEFKKREKYSKGHVELIKLAVQRMEEFDLHKDITIYNHIISIFPKGRFAPKRMLDALWPRSLPQLELSLEILTKMEENGIRPNQETYNLLNEIFGKMSLPVQKCIRIAYLFDKYEFADPYKMYYGELPTDPVKLSKFILHRITAGRGQVTVHRDSSETQSTYILSACTGNQISLLQSDVKDSLLHVEGPHRLWQHSLEQFYYTLKLTGSLSSLESILPEDQVESASREGAVLSVCMCHPGNQQTLQEWMEMLQNEYPNLSEARIVYDIKEIDTEDEVKQISSNDQVGLLANSLGDHSPV